MKTTLLATVLTLALNVPALAQTPATVSLPTEVDQLLKDYEKAWIAKDTTALAKLFTDDGIACQAAKWQRRVKKIFERLTLES